MVSCLVTLPGTVWRWKLSVGKLWCPKTDASEITIACRVITRLAELHTGRDWYHWALDVCSTHAAEEAGAWADGAEHRWRGVGNIPLGSRRAELAPEQDGSSSHGEGTWGGDEERQQTVLELLPLGPYVQRLLFLTGVSLGLRGRDLKWREMGGDLECFLMNVILWLSVMSYLFPFCRTVPPEDYT